MRHLRPAPKTRGSVFRFPRRTRSKWRRLVGSSRDTVTEPATSTSGFGSFVFSDFRGQGPEGVVTGRHRSPATGMLRGRMILEEHAQDGARPATARTAFLSCTAARIVPFALLRNTFRAAECSTS